MKKGKIVLLSIVLLLIMLVAGLFVRFYPAWNAAAVLVERMDLAHFTYELEIELDKEQMPSKYVDIFAGLAKVADVDEEALYHLTAKGTVWEDITYVQIYFENQDEALIEMYLSDKKDVVNESRIYKAIRENLVGRSELLAMLIPEGEDNVYMTLEQANQLFGIDLSGVGKFSIPFTDMKFSQKEYFLALAALSKERQEGNDLFALNMERIQLSLELPKAESASEIAVHLSVQEPSEALAEAADLIAGLGIEIPVENFKVIKSFSLDAVPENAAKPIFPTNFISQETINVLSEVAALIEQFVGNK